MKKILAHIGIVGAVSVILVLITLFVLKFYTKHNDVLIEIPSVVGLSSDEGIEALIESGLNFEVMDTVYKDGERKLAIVNQNPLAGLKVKKGRRVYLVINSDQIPMVEVPDLAGKTSLPQARNILSRIGLKVGDIIERRSELVRSKANEPVLEQRLHGDSTSLEPGGLLERNSMLDLVIGVPLRQVQDSTQAGPEFPPDDDQ